MSREKVCWDSDCFLGYLRNEPDKVEACEAGLHAAKEGRILIVTSSLTLTEVLWLDTERKLDVTAQVQEAVQTLFKHDFIHVVNVTRFIAESARKVVWTRNVKPKDSIHVATAVHSDVTRFNTFDDKLLKRAGNFDDSTFIVERPNYPIQQKLSLVRSANVRVI